MSVTLIGDQYLILRQKLDSLGLQKEVSRRNMIAFQAQHSNNLPSPNGNKAAVGAKANRSRIKDLDSSTRYRRKANRKQQIAAVLKTDLRFKAYVDWMLAVQKKLGLTDEEFSRELGLNNKCNPARSLRDFYHLESFPSKNVHLNLVRLYKLSRIKVVVKINKVKVRNKRSVKLRKQIFI